jgi:hypothetical protein
MLSALAVVMVLDIKEVAATRRLAGRLRKNILDEWSEMCYVACRCEE